MDKVRVAEDDVKLEKSSSKVLLSKTHSYLPIVDEDFDSELFDLFKQGKTVICWHFANTQECTHVSTPCGFAHAVKRRDQSHNGVNCKQWTRRTGFCLSNASNLCLYRHDPAVRRVPVVYKSVVCESMHRTGECKYGRKCDFAHPGESINSIVSINDDVEASEKNDTEEFVLSAKDSDTQFQSSLEMGDGHWYNPLVQPRMPWVDPFPWHSEFVDFFGRSFRDQTPLRGSWYPPMALAVSDRRLFVPPTLQSWHHDISFG